MLYVLGMRCGWVRIDRQQQLIIIDHEHMNMLGKVKRKASSKGFVIVQELCESRGGRPGLSVLTSLLVSVDVKLY